jgi:type II restriction/modification system DNA methylase subunit YeeA
MINEAVSQKLKEFVNYCHQYIKGDEKGDAQIFLERLLQAFGNEGAKEVKAEYEKRIAKSSQQGRTGYADFVWPSRVLIEMKKRGENLDKHYPQAFRYWTYLVPDRPRYVILCNFDQFWIYDFNLQVDTPVDIIALENLPERASAFRFLEPVNFPPIFRNNQVEVTEKAASRMGQLFKLLKARQNQSKAFDELMAQRFVLQCVLAMFAEDRTLLPNDLFVDCVQACMEGESSYDVLGGLFCAMNSAGITPAGRYKGVDYFNGGLFAKIEPIELTEKELELLNATALQDWSKVRPAIFGSIFEGTANSQERHTHGIHFTSEVDIMKIVRPTISEYWEDKIEAAKNLEELSQLEQELRSYRVLDPACGSGNFLYIAYQELKRIERLLFDKITLISGDNQQQKIGVVTPIQFYGIDINPFAVELARVTMMIARKVAIDRFDLTEPALPLDTLDQNIICKDALFTPWQTADAIIGNPPFLGGKKLRSLLGNKYTEKVYKAFPEVEGQPDFCVFWFRKATDYLGEKTRAGLVGTNSITQVSGRRASLDYVVNHGGIIHSAISTQEWSGEAAVHVSIVNWSKQQPKRKILDGVEVTTISSSLKNEISIASAMQLKANENMSFESCALGGKGFIISEEEAQEWIKADAKNSKVLKPMIDGKNLIHSYQKKDWVIDFNDMSIEQASLYKLPFQRVREKVKPERDNNRRNARRLNWWQFGEKRPAMRKALESLDFYFALPKIVKWVMFARVNINILPCEANMVIASDDFYLLGILTSQIHQLWVKAQRSTLKSDTRYTNTTCFETFPFPQNVKSNLIEKIRIKAQELDQYRTEQIEQKQWSITKLYNEYFYEPASQLYKLHLQLNRLVMEAYNLTTEDDILAKLLALNLELAEREKQGETIIGAKNFRHFSPI